MAEAPSLLPTARCSGQGGTKTCWHSQNPLPSLSPRTTPMPPKAWYNTLSAATPPPYPDCMGSILPRKK